MLCIRAECVVASGESGRPCGSFPPCLFTCLPRLENLTPCQLWDCIPGVSCSYLLPFGLNNTSALFHRAVPATKMPCRCHQYVCQQTMPKALVCLQLNFLHIWGWKGRLRSSWSYTQHWIILAKQRFEICQVFNLRATLKINDLELQIQRYKEPFFLDNSGEKEH